DLLVERILLDERQDAGGDGEVIGVVAGGKLPVVGVGVVDGAEGELLEVVQFRVLDRLVPRTHELGQQQGEQQQQQGQEYQQLPQGDCGSLGTDGEASLGSNCRARSVSEGPRADASGSDGPLRSPG